MIRSIAQNTFTQTNIPAQNQYQTVGSLTSKEATPEAQLFTVINDSPLSYLFTPLLMYGSIGLFFVLFLGALIVQIVQKTLDMKRALTTLVVAVMIASLPITLKTALEATSLQSQAGPDQVPRNIQIQQLTRRSLKLTWDTDAAKVGSVRYSSVPLSVKTSKVVIGDFGKRVKHHSIVLDNLQIGVEYEIEILSGDTWYDNNGEPLRYKIGP